VLTGESGSAEHDHMSDDVPEPLLDSLSDLYDAQTNLSTWVTAVRLQRERLRENITKARTRPGRVVPNDEVLVMAAEAGRRRANVHPCDRPGLRAARAASSLRVTGQVAASPGGGLTVSATTMTDADPAQAVPGKLRLLELRLREDAGCRYGRADRPM
jgi:hypothetical protein